MSINLKVQQSKSNLDALGNYIKTYKPFLLFLGKFFLSYVLMTAVYQFYLSGFDEKKYELDAISQSVGRQTETVLDFFGDAVVDKHPSEPSMRVFYKQKYVARIIEGCNAVSIMILFAAFVIAFSGWLKHTVLFILGGCVIIHMINIVRIALLGVLFYRFPQHEHLLHGVVFPLIIYSVVFVLWIVWVNKFSGYVKKTA